MVHLVTHGGIREPAGWAKSLRGVWVGLRVGLISTRATGSIRSPTGGIREPEWDKLPGDVWVGLRLGLHCKNRSACVKHTNLSQYMHTLKVFWCVYWDKLVCLAHFCFYSVISTRTIGSIREPEYTSCLGMCGWG